MGDLQSPDWLLLASWRCRSKVDGQQMSLLTDYLDVLLHKAVAVAC